MTQEEQLDLVRRHYALNGAGEYEAAAELVTDDFFLTIRADMPFGGTYREKQAFRAAIPIVREAVAVTKIRKVATTLGPDCAVEIVEFTFDTERSRTKVANLIRFCREQTCETHFDYSDPGQFITAAAGHSAMTCGWTRHSRVRSEPRQTGRPLRRRLIPRPQSIFQSAAELCREKLTLSSRDL